MKFRFQMILSERDSKPRLKLPEKKLSFNDLCACDDVALMFTVDIQFETWTHKSFQVLQSHKDTINQFIRADEILNLVNYVLNLLKMEKIENDVLYSMVRNLK